RPAAGPAVAGRPSGPAAPHVLAGAGGVALAQTPWAAGIPARAVAERRGWQPADRAGSGRWIAPHACGGGCGRTDGAGGRRARVRRRQRRRGHALLTPGRRTPPSNLAVSPGAGRVGRCIVLNAAIPT